MKVGEGQTGSCLGRYWKEAYDGNRDRMSRGGTNGERGKGAKGREGAGRTRELEGGNGAKQERGSRGSMQTRTRG